MKIWSFSYNPAGFLRGLLKISRSEHPTSGSDGTPVGFALTLSILWTIMTIITNVFPRRPLVRIGQLQSPLVRPVCKSDIVCWRQLKDITTQQWFTFIPTQQRFTFIPTYASCNCFSLYNLHFQVYVSLVPQGFNLTPSILAEGTNLLKVSYSLAEN